MDEINVVLMRPRKISNFADSPIDSVFLKLDSEKQT